MAEKTLPEDSGERTRHIEEASRFAMTKRHHRETFEKAKKEGRMDKDFLPLCEYIAKTEHYFTSSCCAGRIALIGLGKEETKKESAFHRKWHRKVKAGEVLEGVKAFSGEILWFKQEPLILHIGADNLDNARKILVVCEKAGIKRAGIKVAKDGKFIVEMLGTSSITAPIKDKGIVADDKYLKYLVKKGNEKFAKNQELIRKLTAQAKKDLK